MFKTVMMKKIITFLIILISLNLHAQKSLSLLDAVKIGLEENFDIQVQSISEKQAIINNNWGTAGRYPTINFASKIDHDLNVGAGVNLNWTLFDGFSVNITKQRLNELQNLTEGNGIIVIENTIQSIILAYNLVLLEQEKLDVYKNMEHLSKDRLDYESLKNELGATMSYELLQYKNAYLSDQSNVLWQEAAVKSAIRNLKYLLGNSVDKILLSDSLSHVVSEFQYNDLKVKMERSNSTMKNQYINIALLEKEIDLAKSNYYPTVNLSVSGQVANVGASMLGNITLNYNLFNGGVRKRAVQIARLEKEAGEIELEDVTIKLENQLGDILDYYNARKAIYKLSNEQLEMAQINMQISAEKLKSGVINSFDYRAVQLSFQNAAISQLNAIYNLIDANTSLIRITGGILSEYQN